MKLSRGFTQVYTGNGKGKTTAAIGLSIRAAGAGLKVCLCQFLKGKRCSEHVLLDNLSDLIEYHQYGKKTFLIGKPTKTDLEMINKGLNFVRRTVNTSQYDVLILDEILSAVDIDLVSMNEVIDIIKNKNNNVELILTGRNAPQKLLKHVNLVTEMKQIKHYFNQGITARKGIEF